MLNFIYLILGLCVLGALVMTVYAFFETDGRYSRLHR